MKGKSKAWGQGIWVLAVLPLTLGPVCEGCSNPQDPDAGYTLPEADFSGMSISQGIAGHVWSWEGNFEPGAATGTVSAVSRWILVYPLVPAADRTHTTPGGFFSDIQGTPLDSVKSDTTGFFEIPLEPSEYSLFVRELDLWYFNGKNDIQVQPDSVTRFHINIDYRAAY